MSSFVRVPARTDQRRSYTITLGLFAGYDDPPRQLANLDTELQVLSAHGQWMQRRITADQPYLTGVFTRALVSYAWPRPEGEAGEPQTRVEPGVLFCGEVNVLYASHVGDAEVIDALEELAGELGAAAEQERVYVAYRDHAWVLDRAG